MCHEAAPAPTAAPRMLRRDQTCTRLRGATGASAKATSWRRLSGPCKRPTSSDGARAVISDRLPNVRSCTPTIRIVTTTSPACGSQSANASCSSLWRAWGAA